MKLVYSRRYNIRFFGLERLHPFDSRKYGRAWRAIGQQARHLRNQAWVGVPRPASISDLAAVHDPAYLDRLRDPRELAAALELPFVRRLPSWVVWRVILRPMLWGVAGSLVAARAALAAGMAVNLSGGYHHAKPGRGEGFCVFNDVAYLIHRLRADGQLQAGDRVAYIDLDAHQGNGVCHHFRSDRRVFVYDAFNPRIYPAYDRDALDRIDCPIPLPGFAPESRVDPELVRVDPELARPPSFVDEYRRQPEDGHGHRRPGTPSGAVCEPCTHKDELGPEPEPEPES